MPNPRIQQILSVASARRKLAKLLRDPNLFFEDLFAKRRKRASATPKPAQSFSFDDSEPPLKPLREKTIVYESFHGRNMSCNPYALFKALLQDPRFADFEHVWLLKNPGDYQNQDFSGYGEVKLIERGTRQARTYLKTAKYLINNSTFPPSFTRRPDQLYVNTQHGVPIKSMGKDVLDDFGGAANVARNLLQTTHFVMPNRYTTNVMLRSHDVESIFPGVVIETGYPRTDSIVQNEQARSRLRRDLGIPDGKKVLLYAPTFRGRFNAATDRSELVIEFLRQLRRRFGDEYWLLDKSHYSNRLTGTPQQELIDRTDTNELLSIVDVLITDYSSLCFDFFRQRKPILYFAYDLDEYASTRGLYLDLENLPGQVCRDPEQVYDLLEHIDGFVSERRESYDAAIDQYCADEDGEVARRVIEAVFFSDQKIATYTPAATSRRSLLMYGGSFLNNGVTSSVAALLENIDTDQYDVYIAFDKKTAPANVARFRSRIPDGIKVLFHVGGGNKRVKNPYRYGRLEARRLYGDALFDITLDASGYGQYWPSVLVHAKAQKRLIYLHNCMKSEQQFRPHTANFEYLFELYDRKFDGLIAVSPSSYEANAAHFPHLRFKLSHVSNFISDERIRAKARADEIDTSKTNFVNVGRYTYQKGQMRLVSAFARLHRDFPDTRLYLVGYGDDLPQLERQIRRFHLEGAVHLTGAMENPFPLLSKCDCFVMSSHYEGQGIVLLESLVLGVPAISTDIPGPRSVLEQRYLYDNSEDGLLAGMRDFMAGKIECQVFDANQYNALSRRSLEEILRVESSPGSPQPG